MPDPVIPKKARTACEKAVAWLVLNGTPREIAELAFKHYHEEVFPPPKTRTTRPYATDAIRPIVQQYWALYRGIYKSDPPDNAVDYAVVKGLLQQYTPEVVSSHLNSFAEYYQTDPWLQKVGFSIPLFAREWKNVVNYRHRNHLRKTCQAPSDCHHDPICQSATEHTRKMLADVRGSSETIASSLRTASRQSSRS